MAAPARQLPPAVGHPGQALAAQVEVRERANRPRGPGTPKPCASSTSSRALWASASCSSSGSGARWPSMLNTASGHDELVSCRVLARAVRAARPRWHRAACWRRASRTPSMRAGGLSRSRKISAPFGCRGPRPWRVGHNSRCQSSKPVRRGYAARPRRQSALPARGVASGCPLMSAEPPEPAPRARGALLKAAMTAGWSARPGSRCCKQQTGTPSTVWRGRWRAISAAAVRWPASRQRAGGRGGQASAGIVLRAQRVGQACQHGGSQPGGGDLVDQIRRHQVDGRADRADQRAGVCAPRGGIVR